MVISPSKNKRYPKLKQGGNTPCDVGKKLLVIRAWFRHGLQLLASRDLICAKAHN